MMKKTISALLILASAALGNQALAAPSILDLKHSITDNELVPPESFETKARELEENFYLQNYTVVDRKNNGEQFATPKVYEERLTALPTEIEMPYNDIVRRFIEMYLGKRRNQLADMLALHTYYGNIFLEELVKEGMPTELQYLPVIESAINPNAVSKAGAGGLWQFMPSTAKGMGMEVNSLVDERRDPRMSSQKAAKYLHDLYDIYGDWSLAIAAYNCGPGNVNKAMRRAGGGKKDFWEIYNYLPKETRSYVPAFIAANYVMNYHDKHGISPTVVKKHLTTDTVQVKNRVHLRQIADVLQIPLEEIRMLNPQFRKDIIPGSDRKSYALTLPTQQCLAYVMSEDEILAHDADLYAQRTHVEPGERNHDNKENEVAENNENKTEENTTVQQPSNEVAQTAPTEVVQNGVRRITHTVEHGENLKDVARRYGVSATDLKRWNHLRRGKVKEGDRLIVELGTAADNGQQYAQVPERQHRPLRNTSDEKAVPMPPAKKEPTPQPAVPAPSVKNTKPSRINEPVAPPRPANAQTDNRKADKPRNNNSTNNETPATQPKKKRAEQAAPEQQPQTNKKNNKKKQEEQATPQQSNNKKKQGRQDANNNQNDKKNKNNKNNKNKKAQQPKEPAAKEYTVKKGDTLDELARKNNTTVDAIRQANGMKKNADNINIDQKLKIPKGTKDSKNKKEDKNKNNKKDTKKDNNKKSGNKKRR